MQAAGAWDEGDRSDIGLRVNPLVGAGTIAALSTATVRSKFGVPLLPLPPTATATTDDGVVAQRRSVADLFRRFPFLNGLMCHVGSQGMPLDTMVCTPPAPAPAPTPVINPRSPSSL